MLDSEGQLHLTLIAAVLSVALTSFTRSFRCRDSVLALLSGNWGS